MSFGFPNPEDAYLGLMLLAPAERGNGLGSAVFAHIEGLARAKGHQRLLLAVLEENQRARLFWEKQGFRTIGFDRHDPETGHRLHRLAKDL